MKKIFAGFVLAVAALFGASAQAEGVIALDGVNSFALSDHPEAKTKLGFVVRPFDTNSVVLNSLGVGFRYQFNWNLNGHSKAITDNQYNPFVTANILDTKLLSDENTRFTLGVSAERLANGKSGEDARYVNFATVTPTLRFNPVDGTEIGVSTQYRYAINEGSNTRDYFGQVGKWKTEAYAQYNNVRVSGWGNTRGGGASAFYRLTKIQDVGSLSVFAEYFNGRGDTLINYQDHTSVWRFGVAIVPGWN